ncbi:LLM class flavin-dependent oxidoreductase [Humibacter sp.]|jgi:probable LLM family oxidoreductase|uniref:LLM class flavin-dependent oxidoreductase n=1 Tax=Humibacter sp. TaxID=1940291 RepID=UPI002C388823|nr:LLM class flavin-dependent oxidoreductase [Humibacter sp.]HVX08598.1 LLM class flavin-dependent oxidoreductase [Humibacter sp.]
MTKGAVVAVQFGLDTFGDVPLAEDGSQGQGAKTIREVVEQAVLADELGVDAFGIGEHHRADFAISAPDVVLSAIAARTKNISVGTAVTVLSSDDPVRVYERFATLDAISGGRAEITVGRGSFTESFPLFGYDLAQYEKLFEEKLELFSLLLNEDPVTWAGTVRAPLTDQQVYPKTESGRLKAWVGVGGSPESVIRSVRYGIPMALAIIGGNAGRFAPYVDLYKRAQEQMDRQPMPLAMHSPGFIADTDELAMEQLYPYQKATMDRIGAERGWAPQSKEQFISEVRHGSLYAGSPETVAKRMAEAIRVLGVDRFDLKYANGPMPHELLTHSIELYATKVIPMVRDILA